MRRCRPSGARYDGAVLPPLDHLEGSSPEQDVPGRAPDKLEVAGDTESLRAVGGHAFIDVGVLGQLAGEGEARSREERAGPHGVGGAVAVHRQIVEEPVPDGQRPADERHPHPQRAATDATETAPDGVLPFRRVDDPEVWHAVLVMRDRVRDGVATLIPRQRGYPRGLIDGGQVRPCRHQAASLAATTRTSCAPGSGATSP
ncbi:hypothetical protein XAC3608_2050007 [Xanthomonas citri pv. citri]|uniref:Uncharacterized protein n=1 Tax=Xanthomonas campestris pv. phaseoli TaxID=317013 RepID=A0A7Z7IY28_XANCH|nr:hypothetical protein XAC3608_2050007 [Xanthomonas citri pv. citri]SOO23736.1 hypothetical protein XFF6991_30056 [Xanthomonas phaseoli pv. phaseoli]